MKPLLKKPTWYDQIIEGKVWKSYAKSEMDPFLDQKDDYIKELREMLIQCRSAIISLDQDALGSSQCSDGERYAIRDEVVTNITKTLAKWEPDVGQGETDET